MGHHLCRSILLAFARGGHQELARQIQFLRAENEILRSRLPARIVATPEERTRLLRFGRPLGPAIKDLISIVSPRTFARWANRPPDRGPAARRRPGRPGTPEDAAALVLRIARDTNWGYARIHGELLKLGVRSVSRSTVVNILRRAGRVGGRGGPSPQERWDDFIRAHAETLWACDFFSKRVWTLAGPVDYFILFFISVATRRVIVSPATMAPTSAWVAQQARNFLIETADIDDVPAAPRILLRDNDRKFCGAFDSILANGGVSAQRLPICAPNLNAFAERWVQAIKHECLDRFVVLGRRHLEYLVGEYVDHYHHERPHQGLGNTLVMPRNAPPSAAGPIVRRVRLGGRLASYERLAA